MIDDLETPCVLIDRPRLQQNIRWVQERANAYNLKVRPHSKTHKCVEIARLQQEAGAVGITVAKTDEALVFLRAGIQSVTIAYPLVVESKLDRLLPAAGEVGSELRLVVDSPTGAEAISRAATRHAATIPVFVKIDVGLHRCGLREDDPQLLELAQKIEQHPFLKLAGLLSHAGHAYGAQDAAEVRQIAHEEAGILHRVRDQLERDGIPVPEVSVGSTPTVLASDCYDAITEIRPGNYVFMDRTPLRLGLIEPERIALSVLATVVSSNSDYLIIDAGSKTFSSDRGAHGIAGVEGFGLAYPVEHFQDTGHEIVIVKLSEEHGFIARNGVDLPIGAKVRVIPNHACAVANLTEMYMVVEQDRVVDQWTVAARGKVR